MFLTLIKNIPKTPAYEVYITQLMRYARPCSLYAYFFLQRHRILSTKSLKDRFILSLNKYFGIYQSTPC
jgi:hypothetical protein